ncbi:hypothetical protein AB0B12_16005 [Streptomyces sp. NPDC044780]|uniref:Uncharacterized protein n=1 Tax=Streptomyces luomodiensis TaxID=3026192 RepID=A0ABY9UR10_9ACTN|nr:hypothetical protein [Streptomyces sp. SCA4-21]WNE94676.1 hypothetical protein PS467_04650 [Streptomyces sp. SCA4-21]
MLRAAADERYPSVAAVAQHVGDFEHRFRHGIGLIISGPETTP